MRWIGNGQTDVDNTNDNSKERTKEKTTTTNKTKWRFDDDRAERPELVEQNRNKKLEK